MAIHTDLPLEVTESPLHHNAILSTQCLGLSDHGSIDSGAVSAATWPAANRAIYVPVRVFEEITIKRIVIGGSGVGNVDVGIYDSGLARLVSSGSTAKTGADQLIDIADTVLAPGQYYFGIASDSGVATFLALAGYGSNLVSNLYVGVRQEAAAFPLPATATPADSTMQYIPVAGLLAY